MKNHKNNLFTTIICGLVLISSASWGMEKKEDKERIITNRPAAKVELEVQRPKATQGPKDEYVLPFLNAAIQNEEELPDVALRQYEELGVLGVFDEPSEKKGGKESKKDLCSSSNKIEINVIEDRSK